jgi:hypothetical protein
MRAAFLFLLVVACGKGDDASDASPTNDASPTKDATAMDSTVADAPTDAVMEASMMDVADASAPSERVLWLDAAKGISLDGQSRVTKWADQTAFANDAAQADPNYRPTVLASAINGLPAIHFVLGMTGRQLIIPDALSFRWGTGDFIVAMVARWDNNPDGGLQYAAGGLFGKSGTNVTVTMLGGTLGNPGLIGATNPNSPIVKLAPYNDLKARLVAIRRTGMTLELRVNGVVEASQQLPLDDIDQATDPVEIGAAGSNAGAFQLDGDVAEIIAIRGTMTATELSTLESGLVTKYAL